ncbi:protein PAF1 homolog [Aristolochia californica]|uniref:protein PAF1 homolog n=1 Tax=Aristolochia californica TaxID=171875 RepID=UPI0035DEF195
MASYRPFPPQSSFGPPSQNPLPPPPPPPLQQNHYPPIHRGSQTGGSSSSYQLPPSKFGYGYPPQRTQQPQYSFQPPAGPPPSYPLPPHPRLPLPSSINPQSQPSGPPPPLYYQSSSQYPPPPVPPAQPAPPPPPPPPSSPPPNSSIPPPPPSSLPPPTPPPPPSVPAESPGGGARHDKSVSKDLKHSFAPKQQKPSVGPLPMARGSRLPPHGPSGRVETEEERRLRKKREFEKQRQDEKLLLQSKESHPHALHKSHATSSVPMPHGSIAGSRMGERRAAPLLSGERIESRLKKPTTFLCKLKFRNELPDPTAQPKLLPMNTNKDRYTKYAITSLEKMHKPKLFVEPDLGIPLDLLDLSVYNPPKERPPLAPEDEELLRDDEPVIPIKQDGIRRKDRPTDKGVSWLVKTQYISPLSMDAAKLSITEKQAKELRESREGRNLFLENLNNREKQIQAIEESFKASKSHPVHQTNPSLEPVEVLPLLPDFDRYDDQFVMAAFDGDPTADSELYNKLDQSVRDELESQAIMTSFVAAGPDPSKPEKFLAYMAPAPDELSKDIYDESKDISYNWLREYHWNVRGDEDPDNPTTYLVDFDEDAARYVPLPTKLVLQKKKAKEGRSTDEVEHFPVPSKVTVRRRASVSALELKEHGRMSSSHGHTSSTGESSNPKQGRFPNEEVQGRQQKVALGQEGDHFNEDEDMSD